MLSDRSVQRSTPGILEVIFRSNTTWLNMSNVEVQFKSVKTAFVSRRPGALFMGFILWEALAILGEFHFRGVDCLQMLWKTQQEKVFRSS